VTTGDSHRYFREAENLGASFGSVFPPLPDLSEGFGSGLAPGQPPDAIMLENKGAGVGATGIEPGRKASRKAGNTRVYRAYVEPDTTNGDQSRGLERDLGRALKLAAEAGEWSVVAALSKQLDAMRPTAWARVNRDTDDFDGGE
jgi:hypothetical protein